MLNFEKFLTSNSNIEKIKKTYLPTSNETNKVYSKISENLQKIENKKTIFPQIIKQNTMKNPNISSTSHRDNSEKVNLIQSEKKIRRIYAKRYRGNSDPEVNKKGNAMMSEGLGVYPNNFSLQKEKLYFLKPEDEKETLTEKKRPLKNITINEYKDKKTSLSERKDFTKSSIDFNLSQIKQNNKIENNENVLENSEKKRETYRNQIANKGKAKSTAEYNNSNLNNNNLNNNMANVYSTPIKIKNDIVKKAQDKFYDNDIDEKYKFYKYRNLIFGPYISKDKLKSHLLLVYKGLKYSKKCLRSPSLSFIKSKQIVLETSNMKILDLDETLIHANLKFHEKDPGTHCVIGYDDNNQESKIVFKIRPHALQFLSLMSEHYEIIIFSAAAKYYAELVTNYMDPDKKYISFILSRPFCFQTKNGFYIKDLRILSNRNLETMLIVDNLVHSFGFQLENGVPILSWHGEEKDEELKYLGNYLINVAQATNMKDFNRDSLKLDSLLSIDINELI